MTSSSCLRSAGVGIALAALAVAPDARACGGTFCDRPAPGLPPMPVDQSGENILFVLAGGRVEAHVQIQYTGDPARFAWLVPVPAVPEVSVGSDALFVNLLNATVPTFSVTNSVQSCSGGSDSVSTPSGGCGFSGADMGAAFDGTGSDGGSDTHADVAVGHESVGAFDVTTLSATSAAEVAAWLDANGFLYEPTAVPLLQDYIDRGHVFVAVKLTPGTGVNEIHPLVLSYPGDEPCIPLKLTSVAATDDMAVRAFFLGDRRVVPTTYREVTLNPARLDWVGMGTNYTSVVSRAVDEPGADGHAFVTEYAGTSSAVSRSGIYDARWSADAFRTAAPETVVDLLIAQGLVTCTPGQPCVTNHPLVLPIVREFLPAPPGVPERDFYACLACNRDAIDANAWNGEAFAGDIEERVFAPGRHAEGLLEGATYATRLFTTISPKEMTEDPIFATATLSAPPVSSVLSATIDSRCSGDQALEVSGLADVSLDAGQMPSFTNEMPYSSSVREYDWRGEQTPVADSGEVIDSRIADWNDSQGFPHSGPSLGGGNAGNGYGSDDSGAGTCGVARGFADPTNAIGITFAVSLARRLLRRRASRPAAHMSSK